MDLPVIIVPGILGTRLVNSSGDPVWDPDDVFSRATARALTLRNMNMRALPNPRPSSDAARQIRGRRVVNAGHLVWDKGYKNLVRSLSSPQLSHTCGRRIRVYGSGYDWRRSNQQSARRLRNVVSRAMEQTGSPNVILVAHSMGGIVSRLFMRNERIGGRPGSAYVSRLILLGSPTHGASTMYRILRQSFVSADEFREQVSLSDIADIEIDEFDEGVIGAIGRRVARMLHHFESPYELLPTRAFCRHYPNWVRFDTSRAGIRDASDPRTFYTNRFTGIPRRPRNLRFHFSLERDLGAYMPSQSVILYSSNVDTPTFFRIQRDGDLERGGSSSINKGDGRVPTYSGRAGGSSRTAIRRDLSTVDHGGLASSNTAIWFIRRYITDVCRGAGGIRRDSRAA